MTDATLPRFSVRYFDRPEETMLGSMDGIRGLAALFDEAEQQGYRVEQVVVAPGLIDELRELVPPSSLPSNAATWNGVALSINPNLAPAMSVLRCTKDVKRG